jgi:hypothetical protein
LLRLGWILSVETLGYFQLSLRDIESRIGGSQGSGRLHAAIILVFVFPAPGGTQSLKHDFASSGRG